MSNTSHQYPDGFAPPIHPGIHMTIKNNQFKIAVSLRNPTPNPVALRTMSTKLFSVRLQQKHGDHLWSPNIGAGQAVTYWTLDPHSRITTHYTVPNTKTAEATADEYLEEFADTVFNTPEDVTVVTGTERPDPDNYDTDIHYECAVEPADVGIVQVIADIPSGNNYVNTITRQFDLRTHPTRALDKTIPCETRNAITNSNR